MTRDLADALARVRTLLLDDGTSGGPGLVRGLASGRRRGQDAPPHRRVELRWVDLRAGRQLQVVTHDGTQARTANHAAGAEAEAAVDALLALPFGNWHVDSTTETTQLRVTKKGEALLGTTRREAPVEVERGHDRAKQRLLPEDDPVLAALGLTDAQSRLKPSRRAKHRQVEEFLRLLDAALTDALASGELRRPTAEDPLRVVDLGCGNAYLSLAAQRWLTTVRGLPVRVTGVDVKEQSREHGAAVAQRLGMDAAFVVGTIDGVRLDPAPEVVLALHACDTATDDALARALEWRAPVVLAAPCCHHDVAAQLRAAEEQPFAALTRDGILRERLADTLTDALRASRLRAEGWRTDVVEFVESSHTPRNTLLRAVRTGRRSVEARAEHDALVGTWGLRPHLDVLLDAGDRS